jgi:hypothetical protein
LCQLYDPQTSGENVQVWAFATGFDGGAQSFPAATQCVISICNENRWHPRESSQCYRLQSILMSP